MILNIFPFPKLRYLNTRNVFNINVEKILANRLKLRIVIKHGHRVSPGTLFKLLTQLILRFSNVFNLA